MLDMHAHYYGGLVDSLARRTRRPLVSQGPDGSRWLNAMTATTLMGPAYWDMPTRLAAMDAAGIACQLVTFPGALGLDVEPAGEVATLIADFNDHLAELCRGSSGRLAGLAGLPLADMAAASHELKRTRTSLGLAGAILPGNYFRRLDTAIELSPLLRAADDVGALLMIHPGLMPGELPPEAPPDPSILRASALDLQASLSHMALTLLAGGFPRTYRNVTFQVVNLGGTLPFIVERMDLIAATRGIDPIATRDGLRTLVYDGASLGPRALLLAAEVVGADRLMLGSDYPIFPIPPMATAIAEARLTREERAAIRSGTARRVLDRLGIPVAPDTEPRSPRC